MRKKESVMRDTLAEFFGMLQYKVKHGFFTVDDVKAMLRAVESCGGLSATIQDLAGYYHTSEVNVRSVIKRRIIDKPKRKVYYDFLQFSDVVPPSWHERVCQPID